jgi:hypothetical protein
MLAAVVAACAGAPALSQTKEPAAVADSNLEAVAQQMPDCKEFRNDCQVCVRLADGKLRCSNIGIACTPSGPCDARRRRSRKSRRNRLNVFPLRWSDLARRLVEIGHAPPTAAAAQALPELNGGEILSEFRNEIGGVEHAPVLAAAADGEEGHLGGDQLAEGSANTPASRA